MTPSNPPVSAAECLYSRHDYLPIDRCVVAVFFLMGVDSV